MLFPFLFCAYMRAKTVAEHPSSWPYREGAHFLSMTEEYLKGKRKRIAPTYHAAIAQLS